MRSLLRSYLELCLYNSLLGGVLITGPVGSGKTTLLRSVLAELDVPWLHATSSNWREHEKACLVVEDVDRWPLPELADLVSALRREGGPVVLATSSSPEEVPSLLTERLAFRFDLDSAEGSIDGPPAPEWSLTTLASESIRLGCSPGVLANAMRAASALAGSVHGSAHYAAEPSSDHMAWAAAHVLVWHAAPDNTSITRQSDGARKSDGNSDAEPSSPEPSAHPREGRHRETPRREIPPGDQPPSPVQPLAVPDDAPISRAKSAFRADRKGSSRTGLRLGRAVGTSIGRTAGATLSIHETLRAALPWQRLRQANPPRLKIAAQDLRWHRRAPLPSTLVIMLVDASGSMGQSRIRRAKQAAEAVLASAYRKGQQVALVVCQGRSAHILLTPTRSLSRVREALAGCRTGGATPLAAGLIEAVDLARSALGRSATQVELRLFTDGRANVPFAPGGNVAGEIEALLRELHRLGVSVLREEIS